ncbi:MAG: hypothetical protein EOM20_08040 [Spartobacteria bacterium]|nr:hypothetical protein [Spartobacteria bacterium]
MQKIRYTGKIIGVIVLFSLMGGCASMPGGVAPSSTPIEGREYINLGRVVSGDSSIYLLGILPVSDSNSTRDAIDAAIRSKNGDAMINITVDTYAQFWILFTRRVTKIDGDVIRFKN